LFSSTDLHIDLASLAASAINSAGATGTGILTDIDGDTRTSPPDIGADEFTLTNCSGTPTAGTVSFTGGATACVGVTKVMSASGATIGGGITYQWEISATGGGVGFSNVSGGSGATTTSYTTGTLATGTYYYRLSVTCSAGPTTVYSSEITLNVVAPAAVSISPSSANYCAPGGVAVDLNASNVSTYAWSHSLGAGSGPKSVTPVSTTTYTVTGTDANGCTSTASSVITVVPGVSLTATATPAIFCAGGNAQLQATATQVTGYTLNGNSGVSFIDIDATGTSVGTLGDDTEHNFAVPNVTIGGVLYTSARVGTNGVIALGSTTGDIYVNSAGTTLPSTTNPAGNTLLVPYWDDLDIQLGGTIKTHTVGNKFIIQFTNINHDAFTTGGITFQVQCDIVTGRIDYVYPDVTFGSASYDGGVSATIGLQFTGTSAIQYSHNTLSLVDGQSISFIPNPVSFSYVWSESIPATVNLSSTSIANPLANTVNTTEIYTVTATGALGCQATASATVTIAAASLTASAAATINPVCAGASTGVSVTVPVGSGCSPYSYAWSANAGPVGNVASFSVNPLSGPQTYSVTVTDNNGTTVLASVVVSVNPTPTVVITPTPASAIKCGASGNVSLAVSGATTYAWSSGSGNPNVVSPTSTTTYTVTGTTSGCTATATQVVTVSPLPLVSATATPSVVCNNGSTQLLATATIADLPYTQAAIAHAPVAVPGTGVTFLIDDVNYVVPTSGDEDDGYWTATLPFTFTFNGVAYTQASIGTNGDLMFGSTIANGGYNNVLPSTTDPDNFIAGVFADYDLSYIGSGDIRYFTTGTAPNRKFVVDYVDVWFYTFAGDGSLGATSFQIILNETTNTAEVHTTSLSNTTTNKAQGVELLGTTATTVVGRNNTAVWSGLPDAVRFSPPAAPTFTYAWSESIPAVVNLSSTSIANPLANLVAATETYTVTVTNSATSCSASASVNVTLTAGSITPSITPATATICAGASTTLTASATGGSTPLTFAWSNGDNTAAVSVSPSATATYTVTITDACGTTASASRLVTVNPLPTPSITPSPASALICGTGSVTLNAASGVGSPTYAWSNSLGSGAGPKTATPTATTIYTVTATLSSCTATASQVVTVSALPVLSASANPTTVCTGSSSQLNVNASVPTGYITNTNSGVAFININATGTSVGTVGDDTEHNIAVPNFVFNGTNYTSARVGANGGIILGATAGDVPFTNPTAFPVAAIGSSFAILYPFGDDLDINLGGTIKTQTVGSIFIIQYTNVDHNLYTTGGITFQVQFDLVSGAIHYVYQDVVFGSATYDNGASATVALQWSASGYSLVAANTVSVTNGQSITFTPGPQPTYTYNWSPATFLSSTSIANPIANAVTSSIGYTVTVTTSSGCTASTNVNLNTTSPPSASAANSGPYNIGDNILLNGGNDPSATYAWSGPSAFTSGVEDPTVIYATVAKAGVYTVTVTGTNTCTATASTTVVVNPPTTSTWTAGAGTTDWFNPNNWSPVGVPNNCGASATIPTSPSGGAIFPVVSGTSASVGNLTVQNNAKIDISNNLTLSVCGNFVGGTSANASIGGAGKLVLVQSSVLQTISGRVKFETLRVENTGLGSSEITGGNTQINTALELKSGNLKVANASRLTFLSNSASHSAVFDNFSTGFTGTFMNGVSPSLARAQRSYNATGGLTTFGFHHTSSPFNNLADTKFGANGVAGYLLNSDCDDVESDLGTPYGNVQEYDETNGAACSLEGWKTIKNTILQNGKGYAVKRNGAGTLTVDGAFNLNSSYTQFGLTNSNWTNTTLMGRTVTSGDHMVGNPYLAYLNVSNASHSANAGFTGTIYVWNTFGPLVDTYTEYQPATEDVVIPPFGAFWVKKTPGGTADYAINGSDRTRTETATFNKQTLDHVLYITAANTTTGKLDNARVAFAATAEATYEPQTDAEKMIGGYDRHSIYTNIGNMMMARNIHKSIEETSTIPMGFYVGATGNYELSFDGINTFDPTSYVYLEDKQTNAMHNIRNGNYSFSAVNTDAQDRFVLHFTPKAAIQSADATCNSNGQITIEQPGTATWNYTITDNANNTTMAQGTLNNSNPIAVAAPTGTYQISLTDNNGYQVVKNVQVNGKTPIVATMTANATMAEVDEPITLSNTTQGSTNQTWDMGNSVQFSTPLVNYSYPSEGVYTVTLSTINADGCQSTMTETITITQKTATSLSNLTKDKLKVWSYDNKVMVDFSKQPGDAVVIIYNLLGQEISHEPYNGNGVYSKVLSNNELGYILIKIQQGDKLTTKKLFISQL
jgi:hypothetical protein